MSADGALLAYSRAFNQRDLKTAVALFSHSALFEMPLLGQRLIGRDEIRAGLEQMFAVAQSCTIEIAGIRSSKSLAIAEARLTAKLHRDSVAESLPMAMVLETNDGAVSRLSTYLDVKMRRLWTDGPIFAGPTNPSSGQ
jgi:hypothetical protein